MTVDVLNTSVVDLVDHWSATTPSAVAAEWKGKTLTYSQLRHASLHVSQALLAAGARPGGKVPLLTEMSLEMLPAIIGILRIGACYVPIDVAAWSKDRISSALDSVSAPVVLVTCSIKGLSLPTIVNFQTQWLTLLPEDNSHLLCKLTSIRQRLTPEHLAYVIFTSGTTGRPKGVMVPHRAIYNLVSLTEGDVMKVTPGRRVLLTFSIAFDGCAGIVWSTMTNGGTLVMASSSDFPERAATCHIAIFTPSMLSTLEPSPAYNRIEEIFLGGEAPNMAVVRQWITPTRQVYNAYGPSEATVAVTVTRMDPNEEPILGEVIPGVRLVLVNEEMEEAEVGEIMIAGPCLATGYINNPEVTAKKFIQWKGERFYRTGDRAKRTHRGLEWAGRVDSLVKNRGFLVNLESEVEPALLRFGSVRVATAFIWRTKMIGCVQPADVNTDELRKFMCASFDHFIVPDELLAMDQFPLTANGKVDSNALRAQLDSRMACNESRTDLNGVTSAYDTVRLGFANVLFVPLGDLDESSSFTKLGGNSLIAIRLSQYLLKRNFPVSIQDIIKSDTIGNIRDRAEANTSLSQLIDTPDSSKSVPMTDMQRHMLSESQKDISKNCVIFRMRYTGSPIPLVTELRDSWMKVLSHHDIFQIRFDLDTWTQKSSGSLNWSWEEVIVSDFQYDEAVETHEKSVLADLENGKTLGLSIPHCALTCIAASESGAATVIWRLHHTLIDGFSLDILLQELRTVLNGKDLPPAPRYLDYARFYQNYKTQNLVNVANTWGPMLKTLSTNSPLRIVRPSQKPAPVGVFREEATPAGVKKNELHAAVRRFGISSATLAFAAWAVALRKLTNSTGVSMSLSMSGRFLPWAAAPSLVGSMHSRVPLCTQMPERMPVSRWLSQLDEQHAAVADLQNLCSPLPTFILSEEDYATHFNTQVQPFLGMSAPFQDWEISEMQPPPRDLVWYVYEQGEEIITKIIFEPRLVDQGWAGEVGIIAATALRLLVNADPKTELEELLVMLP
ncbi:putative nonribosomal peptide synthase [Xylaria sp. FL0064]|nr:putative nonribosomal peptide synthase [Xylaria sp. FL0064]